MLASEESTTDPWKTCDLGLATELPTAMASLISTSSPPESDVLETLALPVVWEVSPPGSASLTPSP